mgnify:CR=1 FL=1
MIPNKIKITPELSAFISDLRKSHPRNGKIMSKKRVSFAMGKGRTWLSQIETGRLKKINYEDFVKIFEVILNINHDEAQEKVSYYIYQTTEFNQIIQRLNSVANDRYSLCKNDSERKEFLTFMKHIICYIY